MPSRLSKIPSDFLDPIYAQDPGFPESIVEIIASREDEEIEELCGGIVQIQTEFNKFDFQSVAKWFEKRNFDIWELIELLYECGVERFDALRGDIDRLFTLSDEKLSLRDIYSEGYLPESIVAGMLGSLSHGRKTYPECYRDVVVDIVEKTRVITLGHGEQWFFQQFLTHFDTSVWYKRYYKPQTHFLEQEFYNQAESFRRISQAVLKGDLPLYLHPITVIGTVERAKMRNKLWKQVAQNAKTLEAIQDMNSLRWPKGGDHPQVVIFLEWLRDSLRWIGINPCDIDTPKNVMVSERTWKKIIQFCRENSPIILDTADTVYPNIDTANWEFLN